MRASLLLAGTLVVLSASLPASRAGCCIGDPSALDLDPYAEPLRVIRDDASDELALTWESGSAGYRVWLGDLGGLFATRTLNDEVIEHVPFAEVRLPTPGGNVYFLVTTDCYALHCTRGRDSSGVVRTSAEYDAFASCFFPGSAPDPPGPDEALVWATDYSNAACGTCLEFPCARRVGDQLIVETAGAPWGDCDAVHHGGAWARVPDAPTIAILEEMPPIPVYQPCP